MTAMAAFRAVAMGCVAQMCANAAPLVEARDGEALHQMRVSIRRLRAAMTTFRPLIGDARGSLPRSDLRWLMGILGPARDADVFLTEVLDPVARAVGDQPGLDPLRANSIAAREAGMDAACVAVSDARFGGLADALKDWIAGLPEPPDGGPPIKAFARKRLKSRWRRVVRPARRFGRLTDGERHALRIQVKKLRYGLDALWPATDGEGAGEMLKRLGRLQDQLGALNDVAVAEVTLRGLVADARADAGPDMAWAAGLVLGWHRRAAMEQSAAAAETLKAVMKGPRPWRTPR
jgi:CHAD domain-containing protein